MIEYRAPTEADLSALAALGRETFVETFAHLYTPKDLDSFLESVLSLESVSRDFHDPGLCYHIAVEDGRLIGYCKIGLAPHFPDYDPGEARVVELKQLYVRATHHGKGIAQALTDWALAEAHAAEADEMVLSVWSKNERGHAFYRKYGFEWLCDTFFMVGEQRDEEFLFRKPLKA